MGNENCRGANARATSCITDSWPGQMRTVYGRSPALHRRPTSTDLSRAITSPGMAARRDAKTAIYWITGRVDDVINVSGHRMGTAEVESALVSPSERRGRGRRGRLSARHQGAGHLCLCHAGGRAWRPIGRRCARNLVQHVRSQRNRPHRVAGSDPVLRRACQRPAPARSCAASCARSPRMISAHWAIPRRWPTQPWWKTSSTIARTGNTTADVISHTKAPGTQNPANWRGFSLQRRDLQQGQRVDFSCMRTVGKAHAVRASSPLHRAPLQSPWTHKRAQRNAKTDSERV